MEDFQQLKNLINEHHTYAVSGQGYLEDIHGFYEHLKIYEPHEIKWRVLIAGMNPFVTTFSDFPFGSLEYEKALLKPDILLVEYGKINGTHHFYFEKNIEGLDVMAFCQFIDWINAGNAKDPENRRRVGRERKTKPPYQHALVYELARTSLWGFWIHHHVTGNKLELILQITMKEEG